MPRTLTLELLDCYKQGPLHTPARRPESKENTMNLLLIIVIIAAIVLAVVGGLVQALQFLLWVGIVLAALAIIAFLIRSISGRRV
jgi:quinol-cytochrome oxidoreductase complex cytochrome b subunit